MKNASQATTHFDQTTVDTGELMAYLCKYPQYLKAGMYAGVGEKALDYLAYTDDVDFWLRGYLMGRPKTLHRLFQEIRGFIAYDEKAARSMTEFVFNVVQETLLLNEWYELMERYLYARKRAQKTFRI
ncbi:hypothetical protein GCM10028808_60730 [Spirosoma migulaei]